MAQKKTAPKSRKGPGRPPVEVKKIPFQVMLDPRYIEHFRKVAAKNKIQPQDLARIALTAFIPDPFHAALAEIVPGLHSALGKKPSKSG